MEFVHQQNAEELNNASKEKIGFGGQDIGGFAVGNSQSVFQRTDRTFYAGSTAVYLSKVWIVTGYARIQAQIFIEGHIDTATTF